MWSFLQGVFVTDFLQISELFSDEQRLVSDSVRDFVQQEIEPRLRACWRQETFPREIIKGMSDLGLLGANLRDYGLPGMDDIAYGLIMRELERGDSGVRSFASVQGALVMYPIHAFGSEAQKKQWLPALHRGTAIGCFGLTEQHGGSDPEAMHTRAVAHKDGYLLNGAKMWITNGSIADIAIVWAKLDGQVRGFIVPCSSKGVNIKTMQGKLSLRVSVTSELYFKDVKVGKENILPHAIGMQAALSCLTQARYGIAWGAIGAAQACYEETLAYVRERQLFGTALAKKQLVQRKLALMLTAITQAQLLALRIGQLKNSGQLRFTQVSMAKQANVAAALQVARTCRDLLGANGIMDEYKTMRHMCNLETVSTYEGTSDIHLLILGQAITGQPAYA